MEDSQAGLSGQSVLCPAALESNIERKPVPTRVRSMEAFSVWEKTMRGEIAIHKFA